MPGEGCLMAWWTMQGLGIVDVASIGTVSQRRAQCIILFNVAHNAIAVHPKMIQIILLVSN